MIFQIRELASSPSWKKSRWRRYVAAQNVARRLDTAPSANTLNRRTISDKTKLTTHPSTSIIVQNVSVQMSKAKGPLVRLGLPQESCNAPSLAEMQEVLQLCRQSNWLGVLALVQKNPSVAVTQIIMDNNIATTIIHQAITSKGGTFTE